MAVECMTEVLIRKVTCDGIGNVTDRCYILAIIREVMNTR